MSREILVVTPENIEIEYELAGIGSRFLANLMDSLIQVGILAATYLFFIFLGWLLLTFRVPILSPIVDFFMSILAALAILLGFIIFWGYYIYYETAWSGQTPGKRKLGLRVIRDGGYPINIFSVIARNLLRVVDGIPIVVVPAIILMAAQKQYGNAALMSMTILITFFFMLFSEKYQRLGDFIAGTMVVKQRAPRVPTLEALAPPPRVLPEHLAPYALKDIRKHVYDMTVQEYRAVRHAIDRRWQLPAAIQQEAAMRLAVPLMNRLGISPPPGVIRINYSDLLEYLAVAFEQHRGVK